MRSWMRALRDLARGLFGFPAGAPRSAPEAAASYEARYRGPRRCC